MRRLRTALTPPPWVNAIQVGAWPKWWLSNLPPSAAVREWHSRTLRRFWVPHPTPCSWVLVLPWYMMVRIEKIKQKNAKRKTDNLNAIGTFKQEMSNVWIIAHFKDIRKNVHYKIIYSNINTLRAIGFLSIRANLLVIHQFYVMRFSDYAMQCVGTGEMFP